MLVWCASGPVFTTSECPVGTTHRTQECASASSANVRVVWLLQHRNVRVLVWSMCEWSGFYNIGMYECWFDQCARRS